MSNRVAPDVRSKVNALFIRVEGGVNLICVSLRLGDIVETSPTLFLPLSFLSPRNFAAGLSSEVPAAPNACWNTRLQQVGKFFLFFFSPTQLQEDLTLSGTRTKGRAGVS